MIIIGRKSRNTDQALIKAGIELIAQGNYDPTVRAICTLANVNQGMFVYYFGFKEEYMKVLFQKIYEDYLSKLQDYPEKDAKAAIQLQQIFYRMTKYFIENFNTANFLTEALYHSKAAPISQTTASSILSSSAHLSNRPSVKAISAAI
ncbi:TetR/AcrR family transcriptional regulator [Phascolarctobacterium faecium]|uniref:TetR/AcrR family transcriptional regulator n=1 Tax=Phascolarctobacterium faecium TaxID=33025 RepID=UPI00165A1052|nr:TetR/AcrR family transcriptional regulator [Phascolarctobacterium faecium]QNP77018.1 TetR/AcrR family transcriptional regulator [Phascolarctobacterium faecium]